MAWMEGVIAEHAMAWSGGQFLNDDADIAGQENAIALGIVRGVEFVLAEIEEITTEEE